ncbi:MAG: hypothetical protein MUE52_07950 [Tabrizicola sp.]|jgi:hypothetical protein|nr:hypothetical protein [Tabrizicola sp.]
MAQEPLRRTTRVGSGRADEGVKPKIWAEGDQRPPFVLRAFGKASLHLSRLGVAPLNAWAAHTARRVAVNVGNGAGRIPEAKLGRVARFVPSHLRVAAWIKNFAAVMAHASATADPDHKRGNALVAEIEPHLWNFEAANPAPATVPAAPPPMPEDAPTEPAPVVLAEPKAPEADPLAAIRGDLDGKSASAAPARKRWGDAGAAQPAGPALPPDPPGPLATTAIQVIGYLIGWSTTILALPYGAARALWLYVKGTDLRGIGTDD